MSKPTYSVNATINNGIERVTYTPDSIKHDKAILFIHGMWHGAWCWQQWQEVFAENGWVSHAISLPGHGELYKTSTRFKTMQFYLKSLTVEIKSFDIKPILIGHSMGGALIQWYLKYKADDLPATVLVAPWTAHSTYLDGMKLHAKRDLIGLLLSGFTMSSTPFIRNADVAASMLISKEAVVSEEELFDKLEPESAVVLSQHNPPLWKPKENIVTPMLWLAAEKDAVISLQGAKHSADFYSADYYVVENAGHNIMMERNYAQTALNVNDWLVGKGL